MKGLILNIQRYSIHDGGGIRTIVFFKGCPLHCPWCSNPESQSFHVDMGKIKNICINCNKCTFDENECPSGAIVHFGDFMTVNDVIKEVLKDELFYRTSKGGVTLSGGEVLAQPLFALELLKELKKLNIHTAIETCGQCKVEDFLNIAEYTDLILYDLKIMDSTKAEKFLGANLNTILNNFKAVVSKGYRVIPRMPIIPGYTMNKENITKSIKFLKELKIKEVHLLPFHQLGSSKYSTINKIYTLGNVQIPTEEEINETRKSFELEGFKVVIGGL
ncbi:[formate-C-acetyltransferase]-activating enzyme [Clostridium sediminicola]|uniref:[formate-C-acetyltransferase]-activating enzyme n=1 Tax=Clostridium sediminicola TaxID=3114879 RepID=UPI0031F25A77